MTQYVGAMFPLIITDGAAGFDQIERDDLVSLINFHLEMVLYTRPGEIISDIRFGVGIEDYLFSLENEERVRNLGRTIRDQVKKYMGYLTFFNVKVDMSQLADNALGIRIKYAVDNLDVNEVANFIIIP